jgi:Concanavalin A-like lectin/glucanases superfamily
VDVGTDAYEMLSIPHGSGDLNTWELWMDRAGAVHFETLGTDEIGLSQITTANDWHFVAGTYDGSVVREWVDDQMVSAAAAAVEYDGHDLLIGIDENRGVLGYGWSGDIDDVRIYCRALSGAEIDELRNAR